MRIRLDRDDGREVYEGEVYYDRTEYEFEIDASTGSFLEWSADSEDERKALGNRGFFLFQGAVWTGLLGRRLIL